MTSGRWFVAVALAWLALDQLTKALVVRSFGQPGSPHLVLLPGWLDLCYTLNPGAAFGLLNHVAWSRWLFSLVAAGALLAMIVWRRGLLALPAVERFGLALVAGGAAGNLVDRLVRDGLVVDFIHFYIERTGFVWPDFNVADIGVTVGMFVYISHALIHDAKQPPQPAPHEP